MLGWFKKKFGKKQAEEEAVEPELPLEKVPAAEPAEQPESPIAEVDQAGAEAGEAVETVEAVAPAERVEFAAVEEKVEDLSTALEESGAAFPPVEAGAVSPEDLSEELPTALETEASAALVEEGVIAAETEADEGQTGGAPATEPPPPVDIAEELAAFFPEPQGEAPAKDVQLESGAVDEPTFDEQQSPAPDELKEIEALAEADAQGTVPVIEPESGQPEEILPQAPQEPAVEERPAEAIAEELAEVFPDEQVAAETVFPEEKAVVADEVALDEPPSPVETVAEEPLILDTETIEPESVGELEPEPEHEVEAAEAEVPDFAEEEEDAEHVPPGEEQAMLDGEREEEGGREIIPAAPLAEKTQEKPASKSLFKRLRDRLGKTRDAFIYRLDRLFLGKKEIDQDLFEQLEEILITADLGVKTTLELLDRARKKVKRDHLSDPQALKTIIRDEILSYIQESDQPAELVMPEQGPFVIMVVGVNGVGKTTSIGKIAAKFVRSGQSVLLVAGDTFRAAAINQLRIWGERVGVEVIAQSPGADPSSVVFDGLEYGLAHAYDVILIDTAGRLHTSVNLMAELKKIKRVIGKKLPGAPHEVMLVLDATTGQNGISQAKQFHEAVGVSGLTLTKLDGTAKGGIVANVSREVGIPVRFIGIGEQIDDLRDFDAREFVEALFASPEH